MVSNSVISNQIQIIVSQVCGRCGHLVDKITNLYEEENRKLRDDLEKYEVITSHRGNDYESELPDEGEIEYDVKPQVIEHVVVASPRENDFEYETLEKVTVKCEEDSQQTEQIENSMVDIDSEAESEEMEEIIVIQVESSMSDAELSDAELTEEGSESAKIIAVKPKISKPFQCERPNCSRRCLTQDALDVHIRVCHWDLYECSNPMCQNAISSTETSRKHEDPEPFVHQLPPTKYECIICKLPFENERKLQEHLQLFSMKRNLIDLNWAKEIENHRMMGVAESGTLFCHKESCMLSFGTTVELIRHMQAHRREPFSCRNCDRKFIQKSGTKSILNKQLNNAISQYMNCEGSGKKTFGCNECPKTYVRKSGLRDHIRRNHLGERRFNCVEPGCGKSFYFRRPFLKHLILHETVKPFLCSECGLGCSSLEALETHMNAHAEIRPFACDVSGCGKSFFSRHNLDAHKRRHDPKQYPCTWPGCERVSATASHLKSHMTSHTDERPYACTYEGCGMTFKAVPTRTKHIKVVHLKEKRYKCSFPTCGREFGASGNLKAHSKTHEK